MNILKQRIIKATALALVLAVTHLGLSSELVRAASSRLAARVAPPQGAAKGRLTTRGNNPVTVNGNSARTGETVFTGQSIQTPAGVGATVNLPGLGRVDIAPETNLTLSFESGKIDVALTSGCVVLTANKGTVGTLEAGGSTQHTDADNGGAIDTCTSTTPGAPPIVGQGAAAAAGAGSGTSAGVGAVTAGATTAGAGGGLGTGTSLALMAASVGGFSAIANRVINPPCRRGANPSPGEPRGRNDECRD